MNQNKIPYKEQLKLFEKFDQDDSKNKFDEELSSQNNFLSCKLISLMFGEKAAKKWLN
ncbi:MAG: hypothetical protein GF347_03470 [Candidatus Moranbacteria bacterium]|nr:hypothetical protein [Candidatus Moranbacteria bacterium]